MENYFESVFLFQLESFIFLQFSIDMTSETILEISKFPNHNFFSNVYHISANIILSFILLTCLRTYRHFI